MTFMAGGKQYVAVAAGANVLAFAFTVTVEPMAG